VRIFVMGGTGVIGVPAVRGLVREGHEVMVSARSAEKANLVRSLGARPVEADSYDVSSLRRALRGCDAAIRLSTALSGPMTAMRSKSTWDETNRLRTASGRSIVDAAIAEDVGVYVHESFYGVYRDAGDATVDESSPTDAAGTTTMGAAIEGDAIAMGLGSGGRRGIALRFGGFYSENAPSTRDTAAMRDRYLRKRRTRCRWISNKAKTPSATPNERVMVTPSHGTSRRSPCRAEICSSAINDPKAPANGKAFAL
jgi:nucleoside-diphosphate-sugar epimerase